MTAVASLSEISVPATQLPGLAQCWAALVDANVDILLRFAESHRSDVLQVLRRATSLSLDSSLGPTSPSSTVLVSPAPETAPESNRQQPSAAPPGPSPPAFPSSLPVEPPNEAASKPTQLPGVTAVTPGAPIPMLRSAAMLRTDAEHATPVSPLTVSRSCPEMTVRPRPRLARVDSRLTTSESDTDRLVPAHAHRPRLIRNFTARLLELAPPAEEPPLSPVVVDVSPLWCRGLLTVVMAIQLYCAICLPAFFTFSLHNRALSAWNGAVNAILVVDFIAKAVRSDYRGTFLDCGSSIPGLRQHLHTVGFWADLIACVPLQLVPVIDSTAHSDSNAYALNMIFSAIHLAKLLRRLVVVPLTHRSAPSAGRLASCFLALVFVAHWMDLALWLVISISPHGTTDIWLPFHPHLEALPPLDKYLFGFEFSMRLIHGSMHTVTPVTDVQNVFCLLVAVVAVSITATIIAAVESLVEDSDSTKELLLSKLDEATDNMKYLKLPTEFQEEVFNYYRHIHKTGAMLIGCQAESVLADLPPDLLRRVNVAITQNIIQRVPLFKENAKNTAFVEGLVGKLKPMVVLPNSAVVRKGEVGNTMFFVATSELRVVDHAGDTLKILGSGDFFGEVAILNDCTRTATIVADTYCNLFVLTKTDFDEVMSLHPKSMAAVRLAASLRLDQARRRSIARSFRPSLSTSRHSGEDPTIMSLPLSAAAAEQSKLPNCVSTDFFNPFEAHAKRHRRHHTVEHDSDHDYQESCHSPNSERLRSSASGCASLPERHRASFMSNSPSVPDTPAEVANPLAYLSHGSINGNHITAATESEPVPEVVAVAAAMGLLAALAGYQAHLVCKHSRKKKPRHSKSRLNNRGHSSSSTTPTDRRHSSLACRRQSVDSAAFVGVSVADPPEQPARSASLRDLYMGMWRDDDDGPPPVAVM